MKILISIFGSMIIVILFFVAFSLIFMKPDFKNETNKSYFVSNVIESVSENERILRDCNLLKQAVDTELYNNHKSYKRCSIKEDCQIYQYSGNFCPLALNVNKIEKMALVVSNTGITTCSGEGVRDGCWISEIDCINYNCRPIFKAGRGLPLPPKLKNLKNPSSF